MENRDPYELIGATARRLRRRRLANLLLPALPPVVALLALAGSRHLPVEIAAAVAIAAALFLLYASTIPTALVPAARRLDEKTSGRDHFLTLATTELASPMRELVESGAARLGERIEPASLVPPVAWRTFRRSALASALLAGVLWLGQISLPSSPDPVTRLEQIAEELEQQGDAPSATLARELRELAETLRQPDATAEEKRQAVEEMRRKLEEAAGERQGGAGERAGGSGSGSEELQGEARQAVEELSGTGGQAGGAESGESTSERSGEDAESGEREEQGQPQGSGIEAPRPDPSGAKERENDESGEGNRPDDSSAKTRQGKGGEGEGREPRDPERAGEAGGAQRPGPAQGSSGAGDVPSPGDVDGLENAEAPGTGPGWRIVDGRYVRVRVPEGENELLDTERVKRPGTIAPDTPYGNAPLPGAGPSGEPEERQPLPLEYRDVLRKRGGS